MVRGNAHRRNGVAIVMVIVMLAVCASLGYAMLWGASTNVQVSNNAVLAAQADALAESGVAIGSYYVRYPSKAPAGFLVSSDVYTASNLTLGNGLPGCVDLTVRRQAPGGNDYRITARGMAQQDGGIGVEQTITTDVRCTTSFVLNYALSIGSDATISGNTKVTGKTQSGGNLKVNSPAIVGDLLAPVIDLLLAGNHGSATPTNSTEPVTPTWSQVRMYGPTYTYNGNTYTAEVITGPIVSSPTTNATTNPLKIFYSAGDLTVINPPLVSSTVTINGTLIVNGKLTVGGLLSVPICSMTINPVAGAPGLVVRKEVNFAGNMKTVTVNGLAFVGNGVQGTLLSALLNTFKVNGGMMVSNWPATNSFAGSMEFKYVEANVQVPDFTTTSNQSPTAIYVRAFR
jgi:hypothetical protein